VEILIFPIQLMFMNHHSIVKFIAHKVQHDVACIVVMVVQVHGSMNKNYELSVVNGTKPEDIKTLSL
jgi:metal-responsive CopG/Arc/MetJ family transcriptional regulator